MNAVPELRVRAANDRPVRADGRFVLYWMTAARRTRWNFALDRALGEARRLRRPLVVLEALRVDHPFASRRFHAFVLTGMRENAAALERAGIACHSYVEPAKGAGRGLLAALAADACLVVTDDFPWFFLPRMTAAAAGRLDVRVEAVDSNGLLPLRATERLFTTAHSFRRFLQGELPRHLADAPSAEPLRRHGLPRAEVPAAVRRRWPSASAALLAGEASALAQLPLDASVGPSSVTGGPGEAERRLARFLEDRLARYQDEGRHPDAAATTELSAHLHFGHVSPHEIFHRLTLAEGWSEDRLSSTRRGQREGWWGMSAPAEALVDQLVTWRELGLNRCALQSDADQWHSLPGWAQETLEEHAGDPREATYSLAQLRDGRTADPLWNAAQRELREDGRMPNYLRMLWGKRLLEWTSHPREALAFAFELNDRFALDGRDPNSVSGITWCFGRFDRAWGPERQVFGKVRYMSSANTLRKLRLKEWLARWGSPR